MASTTSSIIINAEPAVVLDTIADFTAYPDWAEQMKKVTVLSEDEDGWPGEVEFVLDAGVMRDTYVLDYEWDVVEDGTGVVRWDLVRSTMLKGLDGHYQLENAEGGTKVTYELAVETQMPMLSVLRRKAERMIIDTALEGLKARCEA